MNKTEDQVVLEFPIKEAERISKEKTEDSYVADLAAWQAELNAIKQYVMSKQLEFSKDTEEDQKILNEATKEQAAKRDAAKEEADRIFHEETAGPRENFEAKNKDKIDSFNKSIISPVRRGSYLEGKISVLEKKFFADSGVKSLEEALEKNSLGFRTHYTEYISKNFNPNKTE